MHQMTPSRLASGQYNTLIDILRADGITFENYFRMSQNTFDKLFNILSGIATAAAATKDDNSLHVPNLFF